jgi:hypothetical protein
VCWRLFFFALSRNWFQPTHGDPISWPGGGTRFSSYHPINPQSSVKPGRSPTMSPPGIFSDARFDSLECSLRLLADQVEQLAAAPPASVSVPCPREPDLSQQHRQLLVYQAARPPFCPIPIVAWPHEILKRWNMIFPCGIFRYDASNGRLTVVWNNWRTT